MKIFSLACVFCGLFFVVSCGHQTKETGIRLPIFYETNMVVAGELRQVLTLTNGVTFYFTQSNAVVWFAEGSSIVVGFDPENLKPQNILVEIPAAGDEPDQSVFDLNADGVPDMRRVGLKSDSRKELFYHGEWHARNRSSNNTTITVDENEVKVRFDGRRWIELKD